MSTSSFYDILAISQQDMISRLENMAIVSNNLANVNTAGFRSSRANFQELLGDEVAKSGSIIASTQSSSKQGSLVASNNPLDLAIQGEGFFAITLPDDRTAYTRDGRFGIDSELNLVNGSGFKVVWDGEIPEGIMDIQVSTRGVVQGETEDGWQELGTIGLTTFQNPSALQGHGSNLWLETENSGEPQDGTADTGNFGQIVSHIVEQSNVNLGNDFSQLISLQRGFTVSIRAFQQTDKMINLAISMRR